MLEGMKKPNKTPQISNERLVRHVGLALAAKIGFIVCLGLLFFGAKDRITTNADVVGNVILAPSSSPAATAKNSE